MAIIKTKKGEEILVDDSDYEWLSKFTWHTSSKGYARRTALIDKKKVSIRMHREIVNAPTGYEVDHVNGNRLDNRRCNLRVCTCAENARNIKIRSNNTIGIQGVVKRREKLKKPFIASIQIDKTKIHLGYFSTIEEAQQSYIAASLKYHGAFSPYATGRQGSN